MTTMKGVDILRQRALVNETMLATSLVKEENLPLAGTRNGSWFKDRYNPKIIWYLPTFTLVDDPDSNFAFEASQTNEVDDQGFPFNKCRLTFGIRKVVPEDLTILRTNDPSVELREIPLINFDISLRSIVKDHATGEDRPIIWHGTFTQNGDSMFLFSIDNILGTSVIGLYVSLVNDGSAILSVSGIYTVWQEPAKPFVVWSVISGTRPASEATRLASISNVLTRNNVKTSDATGIVRRFDVALTRPRSILTPTSVSRVHTNKTDGEIPSLSYERSSISFALDVPLGVKFARDPYRLKFTVSKGGISRPIIDVSDLRDYNVTRSEFTELKLLGNVSSRYKTIDRLYLGILSRTIMVIPTRYVILRETNSCAAVCNALVDSSPGLNAGCKFQFGFTIVADFSPIDILQLQQDLKSHSETKDCTLSFPDLIKEGIASTLDTVFVTSFKYSKGSGELNSFLLSVEIKEGITGNPAVAIANMLINQLRSAHEPFLSGSLDIKIDEYFATPLRVPVLLSFKETNGNDGIVFFSDESTKTITLTNLSSFDLNLSRLALITSKGATIMDFSRSLPVGQTLSVPLPENHTDLKILVDAELPITDSISKENFFKYLRFQTVDVQNTQYILGLNGSSINFDNKGIDRIDVQIRFTDLPQINIPPLSILNLRKIDSTKVLVPLDHAMGVLNSDLLATVHFIDSGRVNTTFTVANDFVANPIFMLKDSDLPI